MQTRDAVDNAGLISCGGDVCGGCARVRRWAVADGQAVEAGRLQRGAAALVDGEYAGGFEAWVPECE